MARQSRNGRSLGFVDTLWKAADKLRGSMNASEYERVVLGIVFPKYIDGAFTERRAKLVADLAEEVITADHNADLLPSGDEYTIQELFWVLPDARRESVQSKVRRGD